MGSQNNGTGVLSILWSRGESCPSPGSWWLRHRVREGKQASSERAEELLPPGDAAHAEEHPRAGAAAF